MMNKLALFLQTFTVILLMVTHAGAQVITLERPGDRDFIVDKADLITSEDEQRIRQFCDKLLTDTASPIIVVTIESMSRYTQRPISSIESFAKILFDQWGIGHLTIDGQAANTGILFLVSRDDRKARIELGIGWDYEKEAATQAIMNETIVPRFRAGDFSGGIVAGVQGLEQMARQGPASVVGQGNVARGVGGSGPSAPQLPGGSLIGCGGIGIVGIIVIIFIVMRLLGGLFGAFSGRRGFGRSYRRGPGFGTGLLGGMMLGNMWGGRRNDRSGWGGGFGGGGGGFGGGFGGGSFGGGFSGGRGASGSW